MAQRLIRRSVDRGWEKSSGLWWEMSVLFNRLNAKCSQWVSLQKSSRSIQGSYSRPSLGPHTTAVVHKDWVQGEK
jgi:hypothetical protein